MGIDLATHIYYGMQLEEIDPEYQEENWEAIDETEKAFKVDFRCVHWDCGDYYWVISALEANISPEWNLVPLVLPPVDKEDSEKRIRGFTEALGLHLKDEHPLWYITSYWW